MGTEKDYLYKRLDFDNFISKNMKIIKEIINDDYFVQYGINKRKQLGMDLYRAKADVDISKLVPKEVKCVFFTDCEGLEMPKLPDTVEVLFFQKCAFKKFYFPKNLKELYFGPWNSIKTLPDLSNLKNLWSLHIERQKYLKFLPNNFPENIKYITLLVNPFLKSSLKHLPVNLECIYITDCESIVSIPDLRYLKNLKFMTIRNQKKIDFKINKHTEAIPGLKLEVWINGRYLLRA
jgi:hypothetical protein